jgi:inorganic triphosphatase YgiF
MGKETELKFEAAPQDLAKLRTSPALRRKPQKEEDLLSVYFDTRKHDLARNNVTLRVRRNGDKWFQTVKSAGSAFKRGEWEHEVKGEFPDLRKARDTPLAPMVTKKLKRQLKPIFETQTHRTIVPVNRNGSQVQVALDEGRVPDESQLPSWRLSLSQSAAFGGQSRAGKVLGRRRSPAWLREFRGAAVPGRVAFLAPR